MRMEELKKRPHNRVEGTENVWRVRTGIKGGWVMYIERDACKYCGDPFITHLSDLLKRPDKSGRFCCTEHYYLHRKSEKQLPLPINKPRKYTRRKQTSVKPKARKESLMLQRPEVQKLIKHSAVPASKKKKGSDEPHYSHTDTARLKRIENMLTVLMNELGV